MPPTVCERTQNDVYSSRQYKKLSETVDEFFFHLYLVVVVVVVAMWCEHSFPCVLSMCEVLNVLGQSDIA